jgi:hypothetical protein
VFWVAAVCFLGAVLYLNVLPRFISKPRVQPFGFSHKAHFEQSTCEGCHLYVMEMAAAGAPTLEECVDCHDGPQSEEPKYVAEEKKFEVYLQEDREIPWVRLPPLAPFTYFSHLRHASIEEIECEVCHGDIGKSDSLPPAPMHTYTMNWCIDCHEEQEASIDCLICHR